MSELEILKSLLQVKLVCWERLDFVGEDRPRWEDDFKAGATCHCRSSLLEMLFSPFLFEGRVCACVFKYVISINHLVFDLKDHFQINT